MSNQIVFESNRLIICWADPDESEYERWGHLKLTDREAEVLSEAGTELFEVHDDGTESVIDNVAHAIERNARICVEIGDMSEIVIKSLSRANRFHLDILFGADAVSVYNDETNGYPSIDDLASENSGDYQNLVFYTPAEREAFLQGVAAMDGWLGYEEIESTDYITSLDKPNPDYINTKWHIDDIKVRNDTLTSDEAREIARIMERRHDAEVGINWDAIDAHIDMYLADKDDKRIAEIITKCDGIEIHAVHIDEKTGDTVPADDDNPITHYGVYGHLKEGGVDWLRDFEISNPEDTSLFKARQQAVNFSNKFKLPVSE